MALGRLALCLLTGACLACSSTKDASPSPAAVERDDTAALEQPRIQLSIDGTLRGELPVDELSTRRLLLDVLSPDAPSREEWKRVDAASGDGRTLRIPLASGSYDDHVPALYLHSNERAALGWFVKRQDGSLHDQARLKLVDVSTIDIITAKGIAADEGAPLLLLLPDGMERKLTPSQLDRIESDEPADGASGQNKRRGWPLAKVIRLALQGIPVGRVRAHGPDGRERLIHQEELYGADSSLVLKRNRQGIYILRWTDSDGRRKEIRDLQSLELTPVSTATPSPP